MAAIINISSRNVGLSGDLRKTHGPFLSPGEVVHVDVKVDAAGTIIPKSGPRRALKAVRKLTQHGRRVQTVARLLSSRGVDSWPDKRVAAHCRALGLNHELEQGEEEAMEEFFKRVTEWERDALKRFVANAAGQVVENTEPESVTLPPEPVDELDVDERRAKLAELRNDHTQAELAEMFGVSTSTIRRDLSILDGDHE